MDSLGCSWRLREGILPVIGYQAYRTLPSTASSASSSSSSDDSVNANANAKANGDANANANGDDSGNNVYRPMDQAILPHLHGEDSVWMVLTEMDYSVQNDVTVTLYYPEEQSKGGNDSGSGDDSVKSPIADDSKETTVDMFISQQRSEVRIFLVLCRYWV